MHALIIVIKLEGNMLLMRPPDVIYFVRKNALF